MQWNITRYGNPNRFCVVFSWDSLPLSLVESIGSLDLHTFRGSLVPIKFTAHLPPPKTNMTMENPPFEDVCPIENVFLSNVMLVFQGVSSVINCFYWYTYPGPWNKLFAPENWWLADDPFLLGPGFLAGAMLIWASVYIYMFLSKICMYIAFIYICFSWQAKLQYLAMLFWRFCTIATLGWVWKKRGWLPDMALIFSSSIQIWLWWLWMMVWRFGWYSQNFTHTTIWCCACNKTPREAKCWTHFATLVRLMKTSSADPVVCPDESQLRQIALTEWSRGIYKVAMAIGSRQDTLLSLSLGHR